MEETASVSRNSSNQNIEVTIAATGLQEDSVYEFSLQACNTMCSAKFSLGTVSTQTAGKKINNNDNKNLPVR